MKLLHIDSSILGDNSASRKLSAAIVAHLTAATPDINVTYRDLGADPVPHLSGGYVAARMGWAPAESSLEHDLALGDTVMEEFLATDILVLGVPMYNFTISSQLKSWIDRIVVAGKTFRYTEHGAEPLTSGKRLIAALASGGVYSGGAPAAPFDFQEPYVRAVFNFLGITDITFIRAEGLALGPEARDKAIAGALASAATLALRQAA
jgi:FMN-dependent NADH-azoreductase